MPYQTAPFPLSELARSLTNLKGVGPATAGALASRGIGTWGDALFFLPRTYQDRRKPSPVGDLAPGVHAVVDGRVQTSGRWGNKGKGYRLVLADATGSISCLWFHHKGRRLAALEPGQELLAVGDVSEDARGDLQMVHPHLFDPADLGGGNPNLGRIVPVYPQMEGLAPGLVRRFMAELVDDVAGRIEDPLFGLLPLELYPLPAGQALARAHRPETDAPSQDLDPETAPWRRALALNELLYWELALALKRRTRQRSAGRPLQGEGELRARFRESLPFVLNAGQEQAVADIWREMAQGTPMGRLLLGDVSTGKTVVAAAAACLAAEAGAQTALMAPTEVLARQHLATFRQYFEPLGLEVVLASGSLNGADKAQAAAAAAGGAPILVGTHALLSAGMDLPKLGLVIIDEQHRFGVHQRLALAAKGAENPHLLVLSATPIPRTLALALAGHLEISELDERPGGAPRVSTGLIAFQDRKQAVDALERTLKAGQQAYVICPLVEASDKIEAQDAVSTHRRLSQFFPKVQVGLLHGRMNGEEQQEALQGFRSGRTPLLVATTVVEVGVDVPQATLMVVLGAERFGLSQLHQLRGRVGRGGQPGRCLLVSGPEPGELAQRRLELLAATNDGRQVAEADLMLRGPGEALGLRQSGLPPFRVAQWSRDAELVPELRRIIAQWLADDPDLNAPGFSPVKKEVLRRWGTSLGLTRAG